MNLQGLPRILTMPMFKTCMIQILCLTEPRQTFRNFFILQMQKHSKSKIIMYDIIPKPIHILEHLAGIFIYMGLYSMG